MEPVLCSMLTRSGRDGTVVRALASLQCGPGSNSQTRCHMWVEFVVGSRPYSKRFFSGTPVFSSPQKPTRNRIGNGPIFAGKTAVEHVQGKLAHSNHLGRKKPILQNFFVE